MAMNLNYNGRRDFIIKELKTWLNKLYNTAPELYNNYLKHVELLENSTDNQLLKWYKELVNNYKSI